ncbi:FtsK/SpoIIIE domain-containing protein, partial [Streptomyces clavuligerus]
MQIRLTVLAPRGGQSAAAGPAGGPGAAAGARACSGPRACDVLITAPAGTALAAVASPLASAVAGPSDTSGTPVLYAGDERLDPDRRVLGEPPLVDGAVLSLHLPGAAGPRDPGASPQLHVVGGPDAGGVHLLHGGRVSVGRSADADVPLDDPDVSRLHCEITVAEDGITVADLGSTNGTALGGRAVGGRPLPLHPGALLRIGESTLRIVPGDAMPQPLVTAADGEGHLRVPARAVTVTADGTGPSLSIPGARPETDAPAARIPRPAGPSDPVTGPAGHDPYRSGAGGTGTRAPYDGTGGAPDAYRASGSTGPQPTAASGTYRSAVHRSGTAEDGRTAAGTAGSGDTRGASAAGTYRPGTDGPRAAGDGRTTAGTAGPTDSHAADTSTTGGAHSPRSRGTGNHGTGDTRGATATGTYRPASRHSAADDSPHTAATADIRGTADARGATAADTHRPATAADNRAAAGTASPARTPATGGNRSTGTAATGSAHGANSPRPHGTGDQGRTPYGGTGGPHTAATADAYRPAGPGGTEAPDTYSSADAAAVTHGAGVSGPWEGSDSEDEDGWGARGRKGRRLGIGAWARRLAGGRAEAAAEADTESFPVPGAPAVPERWPDPAAVLLTALGPGPRLWERGPGHPDALVLRLGTGDRGGLPAEPVTVALRETGSLGLAGPRARLAGLARAAVAQLAALHAPADLELVLISADRNRSVHERKAEWSWLGWLPHLRPARGQGCRLLLAYDRDQAAARLAELTRRLDGGPLGPGWPSADRATVDAEAARYTGARTVLVVDGDPGSADLREATARLTAAGRAAGIHPIVLAETPAASSASPMAATYETACAASVAFRECGAVALLSGDVATTLRVLETPGGLPPAPGSAATVDAVSAAWAERFGRALAPLRAEGTAAERATALPRSARLLDELGLSRATPASLMARWAQADDTSGTLVLGAGPDGPLAVDLTAECAHLLIEGPPGSGRTELLRSAAAALAAGARPDRLGLLLVDGVGGEPGAGLGVCTDLPHVTEHLVASDPVRMRQFATALGAELKRRDGLLGGASFADGAARRRVGDRVVAQRPPTAAEQPGTGPGGDLESPPSGTLRLRPGGRHRAAAGTADRPLPRLVVLVDNLDALVTPALGSTGRPAAGSVVRALEAVARDGERLGVHLVAATAPDGRTSATELARAARLRVALDDPPPATGAEGPAPGRGALRRPDGRVTPFQGGRVTGRIPRTATLRPSVVPLEWERMGDPPARRPIRELGNGPTDLALLASALDRAAHL